jgi:hypothetical protein
MRQRRLNPDRPVSRFQHRVLQQFYRAAARAVYDARVRAKLVTSSLLPILLSIVFCLAAVCDLDCGIAQSRWAALKSSSAQTLNSNATPAMTSQGCGQCRHCQESQGYSTRSNVALSRVSFYLPREKAALAGSNERRRVPLQLNRSLAASARFEIVESPLKVPLDVSNFVWDQPVSSPLRV